MPFFYVRVTLLFLEQEIVANLKREMEMIKKYNASSVGRSLYDESLANQGKLRKELAESKAQIEELV